MPAVAFRRGITHGLPAQVLLPIACAGVMWAIGRRRAGRQALAPHFGWLLVLSYIGVYSHVFLDFLNNYGVRLLSPFDWRWFYGDALFIADVWMWFVLGAGIWLARRQARTMPSAAALGFASCYIVIMLVSAQALIVEQVESGVVVRMAVLYELLAGQGTPAGIQAQHTTEPQPA